MDKEGISIDETFPPILRLPLHEAEESFFVIKNHKKCQHDVGKWGENGECLCILSILGNIRGREVV